MNTLTGYLRVVNYDILGCHFQITTCLFFNMETVVRQLKLILYYIIAPEEYEEMCQQIDPPELLIYETGSPGR